ncbi:MAG: flippase [Gammaproteobacteria bacterium]|nr:flippase [Gammaproteobacteria bacterium]
MTDKQISLTSGSRLARNVLWNLLGNGAPLLVAIVAIPILIEGLGVARFGVLTLAWMVVGYFGLFDLGLGRALTKLVAEKLGKGHIDEIPVLFWTAITMMAVLGVLGGIVVAILSPWLVSSVFKIPPVLQPETLTAFYLLAGCIPIVISSTGLRGVLEAHQRFGLVNIVRIPLGVFTFLGPVAVLPFSNSLVPVVTVLVVSRLFSWCAYAVLCLKIEPVLRHSIRIHRAIVRPLINFGGWMTVSNIIGPLVSYMDRFLIGAVVSMTAVAYYATPYDLVTKLWIIPGAMMGVMFPAFASVFVSDRLRSGLLFKRTMRYVFFSLFPFVLIIVTLSEEGLRLWLGEGFAMHSAFIMQIFTIGVFINSFTYVSSGLIQGSGRPDLIAKVLFLELPFYLVALWVLLDLYGIVGAAMTWTLRIAVDAVIFFLLSHRILPTSLVITWRIALIAVSTIFALIVSILLEGLIIKIIWLITVLTIFIYVVWTRGIPSNERGMLLRMFNKTPMEKKLG